MITSPTARKWIYVVNPVVGAVLLVLVTAGVIDPGTSANIATAVASLLAVATGGLAASNISPRPAQISRDGVQVITDALDAYAARGHTLPPVGQVINAGAAAFDQAVLAGGAAVDRARAGLEQRLGR